MSLLVKSQQIILQNVMCHYFIHSNNRNRTIKTKISRNYWNQHQIQPYKGTVFRQQRL